MIAIVRPHATNAGTPISLRVSAENALGEVKYARGLDENEAKRNQRMEHAADKPLPNGLHEKIGRINHLSKRYQDNLIGNDTDRVKRRFRDCFGGNDGSACDDRDQQDG
jgi:hypothetical protein